MSNNNERWILTAWAQMYTGPGWSNSLVNVVFQEPTGELTLESFQPDEQTNEMFLLFNSSVAAHQAMVKAVEAALEHKQKIRRTDSV